MGVLLWVLVGLAVVLSALAIWTEVVTRRALRANPPLGRFVTVEGVRLHVLERGEGPPVVLIHGSDGVLQDFTFSGSSTGWPRGIARSRSTDRGTATAAACAESR